MSTTLRPWKLTLPVDSSGKPSGKAHEIWQKSQPSLSVYESDFLERREGGWLAFRAPVVGARTGKTFYTRAELRQCLTDGSNEYEWKTENGGWMMQTLYVERLPEMTKGSRRAVIIGQIHGPDDEPCRLYFDYSSGVGVLYFMDDKALPNEEETTFVLKDRNGNTTNIPLGEEEGVFTYHIGMNSRAIIVSAEYNGVVYIAESKLSNFWRGLTNYFKVGAYNCIAAPGLGKSNEGTGESVVVFKGVNDPQHENLPTPEPEEPNPTPEPDKPTPDKDDDDEEETDEEPEEDESEEDDTDGESEEDDTDNDKEDNDEDNEVMTLLRSIDASLKTLVARG